MNMENNHQCDLYVHCFLNGRFECECGAERHDEVLAEMILAVTTVEFHAAYERRPRARTTASPIRRMGHLGGGRLARV